MAEYDVTDTMLGVPVAVERELRSNPSARIVAAVAAKGRRSNRPMGTDRGAGWLGARRDALILTDRALVFGDWRIDHSDVAEATLCHLTSWTRTSYALKVLTRAGEHYLFGMRRDPVWDAQDILPVRIVEERLGYSWFAIVARVALIGGGLILVLKALWDSL